MESRMHEVARGAIRKEEIIEKTIDEMFIILEELKAK